MCHSQFAKSEKAYLLLKNDPCSACQIILGEDDTALIKHKGGLEEEGRGGGHQSTKGVVMWICTRFKKKSSLKERDEKRVFVFLMQNSLYIANTFRIKPVSWQRLVTVQVSKLRVSANFRSSCSLFSIIEEVGWEDNSLSWWWQPACKNCVQLQLQRFLLWKIISALQIEIKHSRIKVI